MSATQTITTHTRIRRPKKKLTLKGAYMRRVKVKRQKSNVIRTYKR